MSLSNLKKLVGFQINISSILADSPHCVIVYSLLLIKPLFFLSFPITVVIIITIIIITIIIIIVDMKTIPADTPFTSMYFNSNIFLEKRYVFHPSCIWCIQIQSHLQKIRSGLDWNVMYVKYVWSFISIKSRRSLLILFPCWFNMSISGCLCPQIVDFSQAIGFNISLTQIWRWLCMIAQ